MKYLCLIFSLLLVLTIQQDTVLLSSNVDNTMIIEPPGLPIGIASYPTEHFTNQVGYGSQWIWQQEENGVYNWPANQTRVFESVFYAPCDGKATLTIAADNQFSASLNGGPQMAGGVACCTFDKYTFQLPNLKCGKNTLRVIGKNGYIPANPTMPNSAAVVFAITQDQSTCFKCENRLSYFNRHVCKCQCLPKNKNCQENENYVWEPYPSCGYKCAEVKSCSANQYFDDGTCQCKCNPASCLPCSRFDHKTCSCVKLQLPHLLRRVHQ